MKKSVKFLIVLFVMFLMPLAAYSEMWSPDRVRVNLRVGGSVDDGALAAGTMKGKSGDTVLMTAGYADKEIERANGGMSIQYIMEMGMIVGIHLYSTEFITSVTQSSDWEGTAATGAVGAGAAAVVASVAGAAASSSSLLHAPITITATTRAISGRNIR